LVVAGAGHMLPLTHPAPLAEAMLAMWEASYSVSGSHGTKAHQKACSSECERQRFLIPCEPDTL
jgi:hypothetical protein